MDQKQHRNVPITLVSSLFVGLCLHSSLLLHVCLGKGDQLLRVVSSDVDDDRDGRVQAFIVHVEKPEHMVFASAEERADWHRSFLPSPTLDSGEPRLIYSYDKAISGFAARLTAAEVEAMEGMDGFLHAHPAVRVQERTTRSQQFMGLDEYSSVGSSSLWDLTNQGDGMIIGVLDTGIDPTIPSFDDSDMRPKPQGWDRHPCQFNNTKYRCNNKVIGAVAFDWKSSSPAADDYITHGTTVASCAAGRPVAGASYHGLADGTALGAAPRAYIAVYKAKDSADVLAAFDQVINDGVDVLSVSQGYPYAAPFYEDKFAIGALSAVENGIFVSVAAGNTGPSPGTILDNVPWTLSVGASSIDRVVEAIIDLGDGTQVYGESLLSPQNASKFPTTPLSLAFPGASSKAQAVRECTDPTMGGVDVQDKIVLCVASYEGYTNAPAVKKAVAAGAAAVVLMNPSSAPAKANFRIVGNTIPLEFDAAMSGTTVHVSYDDSQTIQAYYYAAAGSGYDEPSATIRFTGTKLRKRSNPRVTSFSSRGPSALNGGILKPDILGPGHNILSALPSYSPLKPFVMLPGTSLACPHLSGVAALLKKSHPDWTPAAIRSAIMTTADAVDNTGAFIKDETGGRANAFATGAGQVNPAKANDPGLVYDIDLRDYTRYVCGLYQLERQVTTVLRRRVDCNAEGRISGEELNYPSFWVTLAGTASKQVSRTVTNVVDGQAKYTASVDPIPGVRVTVWPKTLKFRYLGDTRSFTVTFTPAAGRVSGTTQDGQLRWVSDLDHHVVRSTIAVTFK
ncbi:hypothetical protein Taro_033732 [Colocasia esculenta]|uniref:Uncharacterized protein n=1 Tax=Colocasia esculenta TaxID=4460 RepID=A0A843W9U3_COLES|nr:hypothetical protein [Colocasia esculenta]